MLELFFYPFLESYCVESQCEREATQAMIAHVKTLVAQKTEQTDPRFSAVFFVIGHAKRPAVCGRIEVNGEYLGFVSAGLERLTLVEPSGGSEFFDEIWGDACESKSWVDV